MQGFRHPLAGMKMRPQVRGRVSKRLKRTTQDSLRSAAPLKERHWVDGSRTEEEIERICGLFLADERSTSGTKTACRIRIHRNYWGIKV
jgi:hypothetical protein